MRATSFLFVGLGLLIGQILAASASMQPFQITKAQIQRIDDKNTTIQFTVHDPDTLGNATTTCTATWKAYTKGYPTGAFQPCGNSSFAWNMDSYSSISSFVLAIEHVYSDPSVGAPPYDQISTYGKVNVSEPKVSCTAVGGRASCDQRAGTILKAPIWAVSA